MRVKVWDVIYVFVTFVFVSVFHTFVTFPAISDNLALSTPTPSTPPATSTEEGFLVQISDEVPLKKARSRFPLLGASLIGEGEYTHHPPPLTRYLEKYAAELNAHLEKQNTGKGGSTITANTTFAVKTAIHDSLRDSPPPTSSSSVRHPSSSTLALVEELLALAESVELPCTRMLLQGGRTCQRLPDGDKKVCTDPAVAPVWTSCLVYSFGLGHDFSFDLAMAFLGCEVFVFDDDEFHDMYPNHPFPRVHFGHVRLGSEVLYQKVDDRVRNSTYAYVYRPLDNLMYLLGHEKAHLDVLKLDIEGDEWKVFEESIFKTDILNRTKQLAIEYHMIDFVEPPITSQGIITSLQKYISFFRELKARGFRLAHHEPNYISPVFATIEGVTFSILGEQLWINTRTHPPPRPPNHHHLHHPLPRGARNPHAEAVHYIELVGQNQ